MKIFISYARADTEFVLKLAKELRSAGVNLWLDQLDIPAGDRWDRAVEEALKACPCLLVILSPTSVRSQNVMDEVSYALGVQKKIVPVRYRDCDIPFRLQRLQYIDFTVDYYNGFLQLLKALNVVQPAQTSQQNSILTAPTFEEERQAAGAEETKSQSWWKTVPGILTALTGTITAVAGLVVALYQGGIFNPDEKKHNPQTQTSIKSPREQVQQTDASARGKTSHGSGKTPRDNEDTHAEFEGAVEYMVRGKRFPPTSYHISLDITGTKVRGSYFDGKGDKGTLNGTIDGNSLDLIIASDHIPGACPLKAHLVNEGLILQGIYQCLIDGEHGEFSLRRK